MSDQAISGLHVEAIRAVLAAVVPYVTAAEADPARQLGRGLVVLEDVIVAVRLGLRHGVPLERLPDLVSASGTRSETTLAHG